MPAAVRAVTADDCDRAAVIAAHAREQIDVHLDEEEQQVLPVVAQTLTRREWAELARSGMAAMRPFRRLVVLGYILEDATSDERRAFLEHVPPPARLAYRLSGRGAHRREIAQLRDPLTR